MLANVQTLPRLLALAIAAIGLAYFASVAFSMIGRAAGGYVVPAYVNQTAVLLPEPRSLQDAVDISDAIVVGTVRSVAGDRLEGPTDDSDPRDVPKPKQFSFAYYDVAVDQILLADDFVGGDFSLRLMGESANPTTFTGKIEMPHVGEQFVLFLARNADNESYGALGAWAMARVEGSGVVKASPTNESFRFDVPTSFDEFVGAVRESIRSRSAKDSSEVLFGY